VTVLLVAGSFYFLGVGEAAKVGERYLLANPTVRGYLGDELSVSWSVLARTEMSCGLGPRFATLRFSVAGAQGTGKARGDLRKEAGSSWEVYEAALWTEDGAVVRLK